MTNCLKCGGVLRFGNLRKDGRAHAICPKRRGHQKRIRTPKPGRLRGAAWRKRRAECFDRDMYCCVDCKRQLNPGYDAFDAHHIVKRSNGGTDELSNLVTLCRRCHENRHPEKQVIWSKAS